MAHHQVAAVVVAVAQDPLFGRQFAHDGRELILQGAAVVGVEDGGAVAFEKVRDEELQLERQLLDVEGQAVRQVARRRKVGAAALQHVDQRDGVPVERQPLGARSRVRAAPAA